MKSTRQYKMFPATAGVWCDVGNGPVMSPVEHRSDIINTLVKINLILVFE